MIILPELRKRAEVALKDFCESENLHEDEIWETACNNQFKPEDWQSEKSGDFWEAFVALHQAELNLAKAA